VPIGVGGGGQHLPQLFADALGDAERRIPELDDLGCERARSAAPPAPVDEAGDAPGCGQQEAVPLDRRITQRFVRIEQIAILDGRQGIGDDRRDLIEVAVHPLRVVGREQRHAAAVEQMQPGAHLLIVERIAAIGDEPV
jgi:hypothetical protein